MIVHFTDGNSSEGKPIGLYGKEGAFKGSVTDSSTLINYIDYHNCKFISILNEEGKWNSAIMLYPVHQILKIEPW